MILTLRDHQGGMWLLSVAKDNASHDVRRRLYVRLKFPLGGD